MATTDLSNLTHVRDMSKPRGPLIHDSALCGQGSATKRTLFLQFPDETTLPTCATCREIFIRSMIKMEDSEFLDAGSIYPTQK